MGLRGEPRAAKDVVSRMKTAVVTLLAVVSLAAMVRIVAVDLEQRRIPRQLCWVIAGCGLVLQALGGGWMAVVVGVSSGIVVVAACFIALRVLGDDAIGGGDIRCMAALSLATGQGACVGFITCFASAAVWVLARSVCKHAEWRDAFAFAPFLMVWLLAGSAASFLTC